MKKLSVALAALIAGILATSCNTKTAKKADTKAPSTCNLGAELFDAPKYKLNQLRNVQAKPASDLQYSVSTFSADVKDPADAALTEADVGIFMAVKGRITIEKTNGKGKQVFFPYSLGEGLPVVGTKDTQYGDYIAPGTPVIVKAQVCIQKSRADLSTFTATQCNYRLGLSQGIEDFWCCADQSPSMTTADFYPAACQEEARCQAYNRRLEILNKVLPTAIINDLNSKPNAKTRAALSEIGGVQAAYYLDLGMLDDLVATTKANNLKGSGAASLTEDTTDNCADASPTPTPEADATPTPAPSASPTPAPSASPTSTPTPAPSSQPKTPCDKVNDVVPVNMHKDVNGRCVADDGFIEKTAQTRYPTDAASLAISVGFGVRINPDCARSTDPNIKHEPNSLTNLCECKEGYIARGIVPESGKPCQAIADIPEGKILVARSTEPTVATDRAAFNTAIVEADCKDNLIVYKPSGAEHGFCLDAAEDCGDTMPFGRMTKEDTEHNIRECVDKPLCKDPTPFIDTRSSQCVSEAQCKEAKMNVDSINALCKPVAKDSGAGSRQGALIAGSFGIAFAGAVLAYWAGDLAKKVWGRRKFDKLIMNYEQVRDLSEILAAKKRLEKVEDEIAHKQGLHQDTTSLEEEKKAAEDKIKDRKLDDTANKKKMENDLAKAAEIYNEISGDTKKFGTNFVRDFDAAEIITGKKANGTWGFENKQVTEVLNGIELKEKDGKKSFSYPQYDKNGTKGATKILSRPGGDIFKSGTYGAAAWWAAIAGAVVGSIAVGFVSGTENVHALTEGPHNYGIDAVKYVKEMNTLKEQLNSGNFSKNR